MSCSGLIRRPPDQRLEGGLIYFIALVEIDGAPGVAFEAGVEQGLRVLSDAPLAKVSLTTFL